LTATNVVLLKPLLEILTMIVAIILGRLSSLARPNLIEQYRIFTSRSSGLWHPDGGWNRQRGNMKCWCLTTSLQNVTTQKTVT